MKTGRGPAMSPAPSFTASQRNNLRSPDLPPPKIDQADKHPQHSSLLEPPPRRGTVQRYPA
jgi:hypothetical protein